MNNVSRVGSRVAIVHPWYPAYRQAFVERLKVAAELKGIAVDFYHGDPSPSVSQRADSVAPDSGIRLPTRYVRIGNRFFEFKQLNRLLKADDYSFVILEQAVKNVETYFLMLTRYRDRIAFWGHGRTYTQPRNRLLEMVKRWVTRRGIWFFAYTRGGAEAVRAGGFPADRITVVNNSIDSLRLRGTISALSPEEILHFRKTHNLGPHTCLFIGGLDSSKRVDFLIAAGRKVHEALPTFRLVVLGDGDQRMRVAEAAESYSWIVYLGASRDSVKALSLAAARYILMPGRVGLVAVDSFAALTPIITTNWQWHAPEFEYLAHLKNAVVSEDTVEAYVGAVLNALCDPDLEQELIEGCRGSYETFSVERMVENFLTGIEAVLDERGTTRS